MEIRHLRYFIAVAELRNFTKAAEASFVAQSALSQQISRLEHELGAPLFVRGKRGARLTPRSSSELLLAPLARRLGRRRGAGPGRDALLPRTGKGAPADRPDPDQRERQGRRGRSAVWGVLRGGHPGIELRIVDQTTAEMVEGVRRGPLDLAVVGIGPDELPDGLEGRQLALDPLVGVTSQELADGLVGPVSVATWTCSAGVRLDPVRRGDRDPAGTVDAAVRRAFGLEATSSTIRADPGLGPVGVRGARARRHDRAPLRLR